MPRYGTIKYRPKVLSGIFGFIKNLQKRVLTKQKNYFDQPFFVNEDEIMQTC